MKKLSDTVVFLLISRPFIRVDIQEINFLKLFKGKFTSFGNNVNIEIIFNSL